MRILVGIPAFNEEGNIGRIIGELEGTASGIIVCDDCSTDGTAKAASSMGAKVVRHEKNSGYGAGIGSIFKKAKGMEFDVLVTMDADGQHRVEDVPALVKPIKDGAADIVIGSRFMGKESDIPRYRKAGIKVLTSITNASTGEAITDSQSGLRAYSRKAVEMLAPSDRGMGVSTEILIKASRSGLRVTEVPAVILYGPDTSTSHPVSHGMSVLASTIKFTSIEHPLKFYGIPGILLLGIGLFFTSWVISEYAVSGYLITNMAIAGIGAVLFGTVLLVTSILLYVLVSVVRER